MARPIRLALAGDVMLGRLVNEALQRFGPAYPWGNTLPYLQAADLALVNLECVIAHGGRPWSRWPKVFHFRASPIALEALQLAGIDGVTLANNHVLDYEEEAFLELLEFLEEAGIPYTGAGRNREEATRPAILRTPELCVGMVGFTDNEPGWVATATNPGTSWIPISLEERSLAPVRESIARARAAGAELVICSVHWGPNMVQRPPRLFRDFARAVVDAGADVYHGHSAHVFQSIEIYRGRPIIYDAGDFVDDYAVDPQLRNDQGFLFQLHLNGASVQRIELIPVLIGKCQVNLATGRERVAIADQMRTLSAEMGTEIRSDGDHLWIDIR